jgi:hypothetical protein
MRAPLSKVKAFDAQHFRKLNMAYREVGDATWLRSDFQEEKIKQSRMLFTPQSLKKRRPIPRSLEVVACLSGLPFSLGFISNLVALQKKILEVLGGSLHYWVAPKNLGLEFCVFKWPADPWSHAQEIKVKQVLDSAPTKRFSFLISGIQINPDGCVVAKGFDHDAGLFNIRRSIKKRLPCMPKKQSLWAHVPLGRILEPIGTKKFSKLKALINELSDLPITRTQISVMKLIHEKRWYMETRETLSTYCLGKGSPQK